MPTDNPGTLDSLKQRYYAKQTIIERLQKEQLEIIGQVYEITNPKQEAESNEQNP